MPAKKKSGKKEPLLGGESEMTDQKITKTNIMKVNRSTIKLNDDISIKGFEMLEQYHDIFDDLTNRKFISTPGDVISIIVSYDSKYLIVACYDTEKPDEQFRILGYSLESEDKDEVFNHLFEGDWVKTMVIEQNDNGDVFVVPYQDNGKFYIAFLKPNGDKDIFDVNKVCPHDGESKPVPGFNEPLITAAVLPDEKVFVALYHRIEMK